MSRSPTESTGHRDLNEVVARVCELPGAFHQGSRSMLSLLQETGLDQDPSLPTESAVAQYLAGHPDAIEAWLLRSNDQRVDAGWYILPKPSGYVVGFHPGGEELIFTDLVWACTTYVMRGVASLLQHLKAAKVRGRL
jgi:hypothetical protein